jgi:hypothetical protein
MTIVKNECPECLNEFSVNTDTFVVTMTKPSNGRRKADWGPAGKHVPAHQVTTQGYTTDDFLILWECPVCGYADSTYVDDAVREDLG